jgi:acylphosphatase
MPTPGELERVQVIVRGMVQGVGFRMFARDAALALDLAGTVRNLPGGEAIEAVVQGRPADVASFIEAMRRGPPGSVVASTEVIAQAPLRGLLDFRIVR